jgi:Helix-turn-helix domain
MDNSEAIDEKEAAAFLRVSARTLQRWRVVGFGPPFLRYSTRCIRYRLRDLERWQQEQRVSAGQ